MRVDDAPIDHHWAPRKHKHINSSLFRIGTGRSFVLVPNPIFGRECARGYLRRRARPKHSDRHRDPNCYYPHREMGPMTKFQPIADRDLVTLAYKLFKRLDAFESIV